MAKPAPAPSLPPPNARQCWAAFLKWVVGVPLVVVGGLAIIGGALWLTGGQEMIWQATSSMGTALFWIGAIALMYPVMLFLWVSDLRAGLLRARAWEEMTAEARAVAIAEAAVPRRRARKKG